MNQTILKILHKSTLVLSFLLVSNLAHSQDKTTLPDLNQNLLSIVEKYEHLINSIKDDALQDPARPLIQLFVAPRVQVVNDLDEYSGMDFISVRDYTEKIKNLFPGGITFSFNKESLRVGKVPEDQGGRNVVEVRVKRNLLARNNDYELNRTGVLIFQIGYEVENGEYRNFLIHGILALQKHNNDLGLKLASHNYQLNNSELRDNPRFNTSTERSWSLGLEYSWWLNDTWSVGTGLQLSQGSFGLTLDKLDPLGGHDPNIKNVLWQGKLNYLELPVFGTYNKTLTGRYILSASAGLMPAYCLFAVMQTSGYSSHYGDLMTGVVSDAEQYDNISKFGIGGFVNINLSIKAGKRLYFFLRPEFSRSLVRINSKNSGSKSYSVYQGQYNPLFSDPMGKTSAQSLGLNFGAKIRLTGNDL